MTAVEQSTGVSSATKSNGTGDYVFLNLPIGHYTLTISTAGFKTNTVENVRLVAGETLTLDISLGLGLTTQNVTVSAATQHIDTTNSDMGTTMTTEQLTALPLVMGGNPRAALSFLTTLSSINTKPGSGGVTSGGQQAANFTSSSFRGPAPSAATRIMSDTRSMA